MAETIESMLKSLQSVGQLMPVFRLYGSIIDGNKRFEAGNRLGLDLVFHDFDDEKKAAAMLWRLHPIRALELFPCSSAQEAALKYSARLSSVARYFRREKTQYPPRKNDGSRGRVSEFCEEPIRCNIRIGKAVVTNAKEAALSCGLSFPDYVRGALVLSLREPELVRALFEAKLLASSSRNDRSRL